MSSDFQKVYSYLGAEESHNNHVLFFGWSVGHFVLEGMGSRRALKAWVARCLGGADGDHGVVRAPLFGAHITAIATTIATAIVTMRHTAPSAAVNSKEKMARPSLASLLLVPGQGLSLFGPD
ncbi:hypothetical protein BSKO_13440 [Bryopsis sp. KO-2023]|nr:hypothetical protein BSKO_13440 [Bryopsis sp. KO-2023]